MLILWSLAVCVTWVIYRDLVWLVWLCAYGILVFLNFSVIDAVSCMELGNEGTRLRLCFHKEVMSSSQYERFQMFKSVLVLLCIA